MTDPKFIMFTGPMFGSKTTRLLAAVDRYRYQQKNIIAFKPMMDNRYSDLEICTHSGGKFPAQGVSSGQDVLHFLSESNVEYDVIAVDEAFMIDGCAEALIHLFNISFSLFVGGDGIGPLKMISYSSANS